MKSRPATDPATRAAAGNVALLIEPRQRDLGGFTVRRVLPSGRRRMVGPFIFFDHMGPATFPPGKGIAVRPHPHIGPGDRISGSGRLGANIHHAGVACVIEVWEVSHQPFLESRDLQALSELRDEGTIAGTEIGMSRSEHSG